MTADEACTVRVRVVNGRGIHARPIQAIAMAAKRHPDASVTIESVARGTRAVAYSMLDMMTAIASRRNEPLDVSAGGPGAARAVADIQSVIENDFFDDDLQRNLGDAVSAALWWTAGRPTEMVAPLAFMYFWGRCHEEFRELFHSPRIACDHARFVERVSRTVSSRANDLGDARVEFERMLRIALEGRQYDTSPP